MMLLLPIRSPAVKLRHACEDHAICLRLAASYRVRLARGEPLPFHADPVDGGEGAAAFDMIARSPLL